MRSDSTHRPSRISRPFAAAVVLALALVGLVPGVAQAAPLTGGNTPAAAIPLPVTDMDGSFTGSNVGISSAGSRTTSTQPFWFNTAWYSFTPSVSGLLTVTTSEITYDTSLELWTAAGAFVAQNDDYDMLNGNLASRIITWVTAGTEYHLALGSYGHVFNGVQYAWNGTATVTVLLQPPPSEPLNVSALEADASAVVSWDAPAVSVGAVSYGLWCTPAEGPEVQCGSGSSIGGAPPAPVTVTGLTNGITYSIRVRATNAAGHSPFSEPASVTPRAVSTVVITQDIAAPVSEQLYCMTFEVLSHDARVTGGTIDLTTPEGTATGLTAGSVWTSCRTHLVGDYTYAVTYSGTASIAPSLGSVTVTVAKRPQTVEILNDFVDVRYSPDPVPLLSTASSSLAPITLAASGACAVTGEQLSFTGVGPCTVTATQAGDDQTEPASDTVTFDVAKRLQGMFLGIAIDGPLVYDRPPVTVEGGSDLGLPVTFVGAGSCTMVGDLMYATGVGPCTITVSQAGDSVTEVAELSTPLEIAKRPQTLSVSGLPPLIAGNGQFGVTGASNVGLPVTLTASGACTVSGGVVTIANVGECKLTATQAGDAVTLPGTATATATVVGVPASASLRIGFGVGDQVWGAPVTVTGSGLRPGMPLTLTVYSTPTQVGSSDASVLGSAVTAGLLPALDAGEHRVVARGTALDGTRVTKVVRFAVDDAGVVDRIGAPADLADSGADPDAGTLALLWLVLGLGLIVARRSLTRRRTTLA